MERRLAVTVGEKSVLLRCVTYICGRTKRRVIKDKDYIAKQNLRKIESKADSQRIIPHTCPCSILPLLWTQENALFAHTREKQPVFTSQYKTE